MSRADLTALPREGRKQERWTGAGARRALRDGALLLGLALALARALGVVWPVSYDAHSYWAADLDTLYDIQFAGERDFFPYSPAAAQILQPLRGLSFSTFLGLWTALMVVALTFMAGPLTLLMLLLRPVWLELVHGNVHLLVGAAIVIGFRFPAAWSLVLLTKLTPGVGLLWFAVRREWRSLAVAVGVTAAVVAVSAALAPSLWVDWFNVLRANGTGPLPVDAQLQVPVLLRLPVAALIVVWAAPHDHRWAVPVAALVAMPVVWESTFSVLVAVLPLIDRRELRARLATMRGRAGDTSADGATSVG